MRLYRIFAAVVCAAPAFAVTTALPAAAGAADPVSLRWKFEAGQTVKYEFSQKNDITVKSKGQEQKSFSELIFDLTWAVKAVAADGSADVVMTVDRVRTNVKNGEKTVLYDSKSKDEPEPAAAQMVAVYKAVIGAVYKIKVDARGRVVEATVPDAVTAVVKGSQYQAVADGGSVLSGRGVRNMFLQVIPPLPDAPLAIGGTWEERMDLPSGPLTVMLREVYTLTKADSDSVTIDAKVITKMEPNAGMPLTVEITKDNGKATFEFDPKAGKIVKSLVTQSMDASMKVADQNIGQLIEIQVSFKRLP